MKFKAHATMQGGPGINLTCKSRALDFDLNAEGALGLTTGTITAEIGEIPVSLRIPFLCRSKPLVIGSIGGFGIRVTPIEAELRPFGVRVGGVLGREGMECELGGTIACKSAFDVEGEIPGKLTLGFDVVEEEK